MCEAVSLIAMMFADQCKVTLREGHVLSITSRMDVITEEHVCEPNT